MNKEEQIQEKEENIGGYLPENVVEGIVFIRNLEVVAIKWG